MEKKSLGKKLSYRIYRIIRAIVQLLYPKIEIVGLEKLPKGPCLLVGNHSQMNGPIIGELYIPGRHKTWCAGEMMHLKEVPAYAYRDFWCLKPKYIRWFYKLLSYIIAPLSVCIFNNAETIAVYHDNRSISCFKKTVEALCDGARVTVFPECAKPGNHIVNEFQPGFVDVARLYYRKSGMELPFVPIYIAPKLKKIYIGDAIYYDRGADKENERSRICETLRQSITNMAVSLPEHIVVPYMNMPVKDYPSNIDHEKNCN